MTTNRRRTARVERLWLSDRADTEGVPVGELEERLGAFSAGRAVEHDLTSAHTGAFPPPPYFLEEMARAIRDGRPGYTSLRGDAGVRAALAPRLGALLGVTVDPVSEIVLTAGTQAGLFSTLAALVEEGDTVLVADPEYMCTERLVRFLGGKVVPVPFAVRGAEASLDLDVVERGFRAGARAIVFSNPHNPTGSVMTEASLARIVELAVEHDGWILADELYARFVYDGPPLAHPIAMPGARERCVTALGPSKTESASGFRIGALVGPPALLADVTRVVEISTVRAPAYAQYALERWLVDDDAFVAEYVARCRALRDIAVARIAQVDGVGVDTPSATAWLFPDVSGLDRSDQAVVEALMEAGILVTPGVSFGPSGSGSFRMCFAQPAETWPQAVDRIAEVLDGLRR